MMRSARLALYGWAALSLLVIASLGIIYLRLGTDGFGIFIQQPPLINLPVTLASVTLVWLSAGLLLYLLQAGRIRAGNLLSVAGFFAVCWVYLNFLSERWRYGDYTYYLDAAKSLFLNQPLPSTYFYPPLWATLLQFLVPAGEGAFFLVLWLLDFAAFVAFYFLLHKVLQRYGFSAPLAACVTTIFMLACAPLLRTLVYVQVNLLTLDLILLSMLMYPGRAFLSALMLALAVQLKGSPAILAIAFLLEKDWRWLGWFVLSLVLVSGITVLTDGFAPFVDVLRNWQSLQLSSNTIFHDTSFDSFLRSAAPLLHLGALWTRVLVYAAKAALIAGTIVAMISLMRRGAFQAVDAAGARMLNTMPPLLISMTLLAPIVWEHHGVFVALSFLLMLKRLETPREWLWFGFAYLLEFLLPTFDFFPWSFGRLAAPLVVLWQMWRTSGRGGASTIFSRLDKWFQRLPILQAPA
jgi:Glycosyltransferase family 87